MIFEIVSTCKGGGYMYCRTNPVHPKANSKGLYPLHRVIVENKLGRLLKTEEEVHHKNEDKSDNSPENLEVLTKAQHAALHRKVNEIALVCSNCGKDFLLKPYAYRLRIKRNKSGAIFCSRSCGATVQPRGHRFESCPRY